ncbi:MAG: plastocyanin/azurin family copper-binding protein [Nitrosopumilus sp.]|nr:plastocyanin/azurin family copper-binding protein [Nitrosopumilus sp.]
MTLMDKVGIFIALAVVAVAVGITATGGSVSSSDIAPAIERTTVPLKEVGQETSEKLQQIKESGTKVLDKVTEKTKQAMEETRDLSETVTELAASKLPARLIIIPAGTSVPGCEQVDLCYDPSSLIIFKGGEIIWKNDDSAAHTVTSGNILEGPDNKFDSGLIKTGQTFTHKFDDVGEYQYFCMIHPWANASITVK